MIDPETIARQAEYLASEYSTSRGSGDPVTATQEEDIKYKERGSSSMPGEAIPGQAIPGSGRQKKFVHILKKSCILKIF